jgi:hypothetical protein
MAPPKATEFRRLVRDVLAPVLADLGFSRPPGVGLGGWTRPQDGKWLVIWTQLSRSNIGDDPEGFRFTAELQLGDEPVAGGVGPRTRLWNLLDEEERAEHLGIHNEVIRKARPNPDLLALMEGSRKRAYLAEFAPREVPFDARADVWFRYTDELDARRWLEFIGRVLPAVIDRFLAEVALRRSAR